MAGLGCVLLILAMVGHSSATWCICKDGSDAVLQKTLDYACGAGADCNPTHQNGPCFNPNTVRAHCSYAVNSYFQKKGQASGSCDFSGTATITTTDPSANGCAFPSSASASPTTPTTGTPTTGTPTTGTPTTGMPTTGTPSVTTTGGNNPLITTPNSGVIGGGINNGLSPTGPGMNTDISDGGMLRQNNNLFSSSMTTLVILALVFWWA